MLALRPYLPLRMVLTVCGHCFSDDPDREIDYETDILQGNLVAMDGAVYLRRTCRRGHGEVMSLMGQMMQKHGRAMEKMTPELQQQMQKEMMERMGDILTRHGTALKEKAKAPGR